MALSKKIIGVFLAIFLVLAATSYLTTRYFHQFYEYNQKVQHSQRMLTAIEEVNAQVNRAIAMRRGFVITGNVRIISDFDRVIAQVWNRFQILRAMIPDDLEQQALWKGLRVHLLAQMDNLRMSIAIHRKGGSDWSKQVALTEENVQNNIMLMNDLAAMHHLEGRRLNEWTVLSAANVRMTAVAFALTMGFAVFFLFFALNMMERDKRARLEIEKQNTLMDSILASMAEGIVVADPNGKVVFSNPAADKITGMPTERSDIRNLQKDLGIFQEDRKTPFDPAEMPLSRALRGLPSDNVTEFLRNKGVPQGVFVSVSGRPLRDAAGRVYGGLIVIRDITEHKVSEEVTARLAAVVQSSADAIIGVDPLGAISSWSNGAEKMYGYSAEEAVGRPIGMLEPPDHEGEVERLFRELNNGGTIANMETVRLRKDGRAVEVEVSITPIRDERGRIIGSSSVARDISHRKKVEEKLAAYTRQLEKSNQELLDFIFVASHDLREPLRKIQSFGSLLKKETGDSLSATAHSYLFRVMDGAQRMGDLLEDLLELTRVTTRGKPFQIVDLGDIARDALVDLEMKMRENGGKVEVGEVPEVEADPTQMRQLFQNLIGNALKYHAPGVQPRVRVEGALVPDRERCVIRVTDNGIGFDPKYGEKIFNIFQRLHGPDEYEGTGIGLAICRKVVERHGGTIRAISSPGKGSTFEIEMPVRQDRTREQG